jgi:hypothetical protein
LKIGIDLDNTIIDYSNSLKKLLKDEYKIELQNEIIHKSLIKTQIIEKYSDREWTRAQGLLYSKYLDYANPYPGCLDALKKLSINGSELYIISHKTRYPFIGGKTNLILFAKKWITTNLVHDNGINLFKEANILFNESIHKKVDSIISHDLDIFIDDLDMILKLLPSNLNKIWFTSEIMPSEFIKCSNWEEIMGKICQLKK